MKVRNTRSTAPIDLECCFDNGCHFGLFPYPQKRSALQNDAGSRESYLKEHSTVTAHRRTSPATNSECGPQKKVRNGPDSSASGTFPDKIGPPPPPPAARRRPPPPPPPAAAARRPPPAARRPPPRPFAFRVSP
ncbi:hypothetical protein EVAR_66284_1 [Eumeta japonica]|uniref:Uncharacterized protein n=1 Tax=Eumeta variegata TaxID=151549 RepID=A0A4C1YTF2_EUMVA|nr:hypothetical protein EVAR_66284_1 [Eumeta japonica]